MQYLLMHHKLGRLYLNMFFGATSFSATTFSGVGIQNVVVLANGNRVNIAIGNSTVGFGTTVTGNRFNLANGTVNVVSWNDVNPNATGVWVPIDPLNPQEKYGIEFFDEFKTRINDYR